MLLSRYITHAQLEREIQDSLIERGGRIAILELQPLLNVDLEHIERKVAEMVKNDQELHLVDGELISKFVNLLVALHLSDCIDF